jgi:hypothetical protein
MGPTGAKRTTGFIFRKSPPQPQQRSAPPAKIRTASKDPHHQQPLPANFRSTAQSPMSVLIPRIRTINVRLSEEEYLELERFCVASGARSISDLVRNTMNSLIASTSQDNSLASSVIEYSAHVRDLETRVKELASELESFRISDRLHYANGPDETNEAAETEPLDDTESSSGSDISEPPLSETDS